METAVEISKVQLFKDHRLTIAISYILFKFACNYLQVHCSLLNDGIILLSY
jgi:hypothetical protein